MLAFVSNAASSDSAMSIKTEPTIGCRTRQAHSNLSFPVPTGEGGAADYEDFGASSMLLLGESPWCPPENSFPSVSRSDAVMRYKEKKKARKMEQSSSSEVRPSGNHSWTKSYHWE